jgi:hypothetical protein
MSISIRQKQGFSPRNHNSPNIARSGIDNLLPIANQQYENALSVDSVPVIYYRRRTTGLVCTCSSGSATGVAEQSTPDKLEPGVHALNNLGVANDDFLASMLHGSNFSINRYGSRPSMVDANGGDNPQRSVPHSPLRQSAAVHNKSTDLDDPFVDELHAGSPDDLFAEDNLIDATTSTSGCAVCLGTGWVGGYDPSNAFRSIYDVQANWHGDLTVDMSFRPGRWTLLGAKRVSIPILLPAGAVGLEALRIWDNKTQVSDVTAYLSVEGVDRPLQDVLPNLCDGRFHLLTLQFGNVEGFTHLELQLELPTRPIYANWSRLSYNENLQLPENMDMPNIVLSPSLPHVALYDILAESVYRRLWKLTMTNPAIDRQRQINGWEVTARLLQAYELQNLLPHRHDRIWYWGSTATQPVRDKPSYVGMNPYKANQSSRIR